MANVALPSSPSIIDIFVITMLFDSMTFELRPSITEVALDRISFAINVTVIVSVVFAYDVFRVGAIYCQDCTIGRNIIDQYVVELRSCWDTFKLLPAKSNAVIENVALPTSFWSTVVYITTVSLNTVIFGVRPNICRYVIYRIISI